MAPSTIRRAIGTLKDQTSISIAKVAGNVAPELEILVVKLTSHEDAVPDEKYLWEIVSLLSSYRGYAGACVAAISKRLSKTRDWIVALKSLMLVHRLLVYGPPSFEEEVVYDTRTGMRLLNMAGFRDEAHSNSWDYSGFVRFYSNYLDEKVEYSFWEKSSRGTGNDNGFDDKRGRVGVGRRTRSYGDLSESLEMEQRREAKTPIREMKPERVLGRLIRLLRIVDCVLACRPAGAARNSRLVLLALYWVVKESFGVYVEVCEALGVLLDRFSDMEYQDCAKAFDTYVSAAKLIDELAGFYSSCKDMGVAPSSEFPRVQRITNELLGTLEGFLKTVGEKPKNRHRNREEKQAVKDEVEPKMNEVKALPAPENYAPPPQPQPQTQSQPQPQLQLATEDLVNLRDDGVTADAQGNKLALALFNGPPTTNEDGHWEAFPSDGELGVTSAWQIPAAESGKADWELALVASASNLSKQKASMAGGFDPLLLNGMYDQGAVRQHVSTSQLNGGSASSVALPGSANSAAPPVLSLPAPDGTVQPVGQQDPFAASLVVPPPAYVQMAEMEKKQQLVVQEQQLWMQYSRDGMPGQMGLTKLAAASGYCAPGPGPFQYGMPNVGGMGQPGGYPNGTYPPY